VIYCFLFSHCSQAHPKDASNVQIYRLIQDWTPYKIVRRAGFAFFGIFKGTEENPNFIDGELHFFQVLGLPWIMANPHRLMRPVPERENLY
jgi:hypothetical protein